MKRPLLYGILFMLFIGCWVQGKSQANDLMIVEFVDMSSGSGFAVELYNPTAVDIDLGTGYVLWVFSNGSATPTNTNNLSGIVPAGGTFIIGNSAYCTTSCPGTCDFMAGALPGVNGNDAVVLGGSPWTTNIFAANIVDAIGVPAWPIGGLGISQTVNGVPNALFQNRITRSPTNVTRYTDFDGVYNNNTTPDSWPNNTVTNVIGWTVDPSSCIVPGFITLPVELAWFEGESPDANVVELSWGTFTESNNYGFEIERSYRPDGDFVNVGFVEGAGNSTELQTYSFREDNMEAGVHYYRLRQVDLDNASQYTDILAVTVREEELLQVYPNPTSGLVKFDLTPGSYQIQLVDMQGRLLMNRSLTEIDTNSPVQLDLSRFQPGLYHYVVTSSEGRNYSGRLIRK